MGVFRNWKRDSGRIRLTNGQPEFSIEMIPAAASRFLIDRQRVVTSAPMS